MWTRWQSHILHAAAPAGMPMLVVRKTSFALKSQKPQETPPVVFVHLPLFFSAPAPTQGFVTSSIPGMVFPCPQ